MAISTTLENGCGKASTHPYEHHALQRPRQAGRAQPSLIQTEYRRGVAAHYFLLILLRQGPDKFVQGRLCFQPDRAEMREVGAPEDLTDADIWNGIVRRCIADESMPDA